MRGGVGCKPTPGGKRSAQPLLDVKDAAKKGGNAPSGYNSPRSAIDRMSPPATIR